MKQKLQICWIFNLSILRRTRKCLWERKTRVWLNDHLIKRLVSLLNGNQELLFKKTKEWPPNKVRNHQGCPFYYRSRVQKTQWTQNHEREPLSENCPAKQREWGCFHYCILVETLTYDSSLGDPWAYNSNTNSHWNWDDYRDLTWWWGHPLHWGRSTHPSVSRRQDPNSSVSKRLDPAPVCLEGVPTSNLQLAWRAKR